jgi:hypothetical protein
VLSLWLLHQLEKDSKDFIIQQDEALPYFHVAVGTNECKLSPIMDWLCRNQLCVVQLAGEIAEQLHLLWVHMKYTVKFCEVFMMVFDIQSYSCFELSPSSNIQEKCNILEDGPCSVLR